MKTYLIQRANFKNRPHKKGIDSIVEFDYMGSAEFEFGALPKSLENIRKNIEQYVYLETNVGNKKIMVFIQTKFLTELPEYLNKLSKNEFHLKEYSYFDNYISDNKFLKCNTDFWWDIENHFMFWKYNNKFTEQFKKIINHGKAQNN